jgi:hypothetical protein
MFKEIYGLKNSLKKKKVKGLTLDIDETLSWTIGWWIERLQKLFGNPEDLTINEIYEKYHYTQNVPYWQTEEALEWMHRHREDDEIQKELPLIEGADKAVRNIHKIVPVVAYITNRPSCVRSGTEAWLHKHKFPKAPTIFRPSYIEHSEGNIWKAEILDFLYSEVLGIVDDHPGLVDNMTPDYKGKIFLYENTKVNRKRKFVTFCKDWKEVYEAVKKQFD